MLASWLPVLPKRGMPAAASRSSVRSAASMSRAIGRAQWNRSPPSTTTSTSASSMDWAPSAWAMWPSVTRIPHPVVRERR